MEYGTIASDFSPLVIKLSTQAEIDFFYSLVAQAPDALVGDYVMHEELSELEEFLFENISNELLVEQMEEDAVFVEGCCGEFNADYYKHDAERLEQSLQREHPCEGGCEACVGCNASDSNYEPDESGSRLKAVFEQFFARTQAIEKQGNK